MTIPAVGERFGKLLVLSEACRREDGRTVVRCACSCGVILQVKPSDLRRGFIVSCGCHKREITAQRNRSNTVHGMSATAEHKTWRGILERCLTPQSKYYSRYGGRGITVSDRWLDFRNFFADMGSRPSPKHSIDRRNNDGPYSKQNCRWATTIQQNRNRRTNVILEFNGESRCVTEWAEILDIPPFRIFGRLRRGFSAADALDIRDRRHTA